MATKSRPLDDFSFSYKPNGPGQFAASEVWDKTRILFLIGPAGTGKTSAALGLALGEILRRERGKLTLARPTVSCDEKLGFFPGVLKEKLGAWMGPFYDVFSSLSVGEWVSLEKKLEDRLDVLPVGMLRGRTIRNGVMIVDEAQNLSEAQVECALTRIGKGGRIVFCGDPRQSDLYSQRSSPLLAAKKCLAGLDGIATVMFDGKADQQRDPLVTEILSRLPARK